MCVCVTSVRAGLVDQFSEDSQQQVEDGGQDGHAACRRTHKSTNQSLNTEELVLLV